MKISYNWLKGYLPADDVFAPYVNQVEKISEILTAVGLEVEAVEPFESVPGSLAGLIVAEVVTCEKHPDADKLKVTTVQTGQDVLQVVCGAPNVAAGQKVILAPPGTTLYPQDGEPFKIKKAKIRGVESNGMICAEDEIGVGESHEGIIVLPHESRTGAPASEIFPVYQDYLIEIGLTPNRMNAQSHLGVARDVCAWLSHHTGEKAAVISPLGRPFAADDNALQIDVEVKDPELVPRYSGVSITGINIAPSPEWMQNKLKTIGLKPINNVVDITNFILHATGQPLHAFDASQISGNTVIVERLPAKTAFISLDDKKRFLDAEDIMICDGEGTPMCIGGVFGGAESGVTESTKDIFLESAVFDPVSIRKTMIRHELRTDAAARFEKGVDISQTVEVLKYAALLIREICGGRISSQITDVFKEPAKRTVILKYDYLNKLSGKIFKPEAVKNILSSLGFTKIASDDMSVKLQVPESNPDISLPADLVEEVLRIDGLDNIPIPAQIRMSPGVFDKQDAFSFREKISFWLTGNGFSEIFTNSITNDKYFEDSRDAVHILNSLSEELTILRKGILPTALEAIEYNLNRQNKDLLLFEFGKTYSGDAGNYQETDHLGVYATGRYRKKSWNAPAENVSLFYIKGVAAAIFALTGIEPQEEITDDGVRYIENGQQIASAAKVNESQLAMFSIKQPVFYLDINWQMLQSAALKKKTVYQPVSKFPVMLRDLSMILEKSVPFGEIKALVGSLKIKKLTEIKMFDLYESDKLGKHKKSIALSFAFADKEKTLTDKETDKMMQQIIRALEQTYQAEIRSHA